MGGWGREETLSSSAPNLTSPQSLKLVMVSLGLSVIICFTTTAFLPLATLPRISLVLTQPFLDYSSLTTTPALSSVVLQLWVNSDLLTLPSPIVNYWPLTPYSLVPSQGLSSAFLHCILQIRTAFSGKDLIISYLAYLHFIFQCLADTLSSASGHIQLLRSCSLV